jgi:hypothetical protein
MTVASRVSLILVVSMGLSGVGFVGAVLAQNPHAAPPVASQLKTPAPSPAQTSGVTGGSMMDNMRAEQKKLNDLVAAMNAAGPADKVDRVAAVVAELVAQHNGMVDRMMTMHGDMMKMMMPGKMEMPGTDPKAPDANHEQHHPQP